ncbi:hypothetical protein [Streptomyces sp. NPDC015350]|uniref:hypothetical protein n=1 Tax=Streptomyces sp. NPDC015350 TaxID=3364955 RepID=UPI0036F9D6CC
MSDVLPRAEAPQPPSYPPKTPPPPKRPVEPPRPEPQQRMSYGPPGARTAVAARGRMAVTMANRRGANWTLDVRPWAVSSAPAKAQRLVVDQLKGWGYRPDTDQVDGLLDLLVREAIGDGGHRISVHLADQDERALILVMSHQGQQAPADDGFLTRLAALGVASCGVDTDAEEGGRRRWALIELRPAP